MIPEASDEAIITAALVVEDDPLVRLTACAALEDTGLEVFEAADGEEALTVLRDNPLIRFVFTDISMPRMDGLTMIARARRFRPGLKVLLTSGLSSAPAKEAFLPKPYRLATLRDTVIRMIAR
jgi:two-component system, cell cycle sensor histidine kinase and response regulator CckA